MSGYAAGLAVRRRNLQLKAAEQRRQLGECIAGIEARFQVVDRRFLTVRRWLGNPVVLAGGAALCFFLGPRRLTSLAGKAGMLVSIARRLLRHAG